jgi:hypothetical protein
VQAFFVLQSSAGKCFVQALKYNVVLGSTLCKLCSTKWYWEVLSTSFLVQNSTGTFCASFVIQGSTGKYLAQALSYKVILGSALWKLCRTK